MCGSVCCEHIHIMFLHLIERFLLALDIQLSAVVQVVNHYFLADGVGLGALTTVLPS